MAEELKSQLIDSICSDKIKMIIPDSNTLDNGFKTSETVSIEDCLKRFLLSFTTYFPADIPIAHGVIDAVFLRKFETIICLCYDDYILKYTPADNSVTEIKTFITAHSIFMNKDEDMVALLGANEMLVIDSETLKTINIIGLRNLRLGCTYSDNQIIAATNDELYLVKLKGISKEKIDIEFNNIICINFASTGVLVISDSSGLKTYDESFKLLKSSQIHDIKILSFSESIEYIIGISITQVLIMSMDLIVNRTLYISVPVTDIFLQEKKNFLCYSNTKGELWVHDLRTETRKICIPVYSNKISKIFSNNNKIIVLSTGTKIGIIKYPKLHNLYIQDTEVLSLASMSYPYSSVVYITLRSEVKIWNYRENISYTKLVSDELSPCIAVRNDEIFVSSTNKLYQIKGDKITEKYKKNRTKYNYMVLCDNFLACSGNSGTIFIWDLSLMAENSQLSGHELLVSCLGSHNNYLLSGGVDGIIKVWNIKKLSSKHTLVSHTMKITCVMCEADKIISAGEDRSIKIWNFKTGDLIYSIDDLVGSIRSLVAFRGQFLISCTLTGKITYWNLNTYSEIFSNSAINKVSFLVANEYIIAYSTPKAVCVIRNPLFNTKIGVTGPDESFSYTFMAYCKDLIACNYPKYNILTDKWVITPDFITPLHLYAYYNLPDYISSALSNGSNLIQSRLNHNPFSIAVSRGLEKCVECIIKSLKFKLEQNPFLLGFISDESLIEMNKTSHRSLSKFYKCIFLKTQSERLPKFLGYSLSLPIYVHSDIIMPSYSSFYNSRHIKDVGQPVLYMRSVIKLNLEIGSQESILLLQSIANCRNIKILRTPFIKAYINDKWDRLKWFMWIQCLLYFIYLAFLCIYMLYCFENKDFLSLPITVSIVLSFYEIYKALVSKTDYLKDAWNYLDATRALLFFIYAFDTVSNGPKGRYTKSGEDKVDTLFLIVCTLSFLRGLSYFRLFKRTRYYSYLIYKVIVESGAFTVIIFYNLVFVAFLFYIASCFKKSFWVYLGYSFNILGDYFETADYDEAEWTVFTLSVILQYMVVYTLLVSIFTHTFSNVILTIDIANIKALAHMSLEVERNLFWNRKQTQKKFLQVCTKETLHQKKLDTDANIKKLKIMVKGMSRKLNEALDIKKDLQKVIESNRIIYKALPKASPSDKKKDAILFVALLIKTAKIENPADKKLELAKIHKLINSF